MRSLSSLFFCSLLALVAGQGSASDVWPGFRGSGNSLSEAAELPLEWSEKKNVAWRATLPGYGQSSPVIWKEKVFVTSVEGELKETNHLLCVALASGEVRWAKSFSASQRTKLSDYTSKAAPTPAVDGERVYAFYESGDVVALDHDGELAWKRSLTRDYGSFEGNHGLGSSPALAGDAVIILVAHGGDCYLAALSRTTGETLWKVARGAGTGWSSPIVASVGGREVIFVSVGGRVEAHAARDGRQLWSIDGLEGNNVPSPTVAGHLVVVGASAVGSNVGIRLPGGAGEEVAKIVWRDRGVTSSFGSPLVHRGRAYFVNRAGVAFCLQLENGETLWKERLPASCWASPVGAGDRIYFFTKDGKTVVLGAGSSFERLAENSLTVTGRVYGVAAVDGVFVVRTGTDLIRIGLADPLPREARF